LTATSFGQRPEPKNEPLRVGPMLAEMLLVPVLDQNMLQKVADSISAAVTEAVRRGIEDAVASLNEQKPAGDPGES
jgi:hypothetical protein